MYIKAEMVVCDTLVEDVVYHVDLFIYVVVGRFFITSWRSTYTKVNSGGGGTYWGVIRLVTEDATLVHVMVQQSVTMLSYCQFSSNFVTP
jgi:hypothetical protein